MGAFLDNHCSFLFLMDPYSSLNLETETSLLIMQELKDRGHAVFWAEANALYLRQEDPRASVQYVESAEPVRLGKKCDRSLNGFDSVLVRFDPPFDVNYLHCTYILDHLAPSVTQFNPVSALRNFNEKLLAMRWPEFTPPTVVAMDQELIRDFAKEHQTIVIKPLDDCSGRGIVKLSYEEILSDDQLLSRILVGQNGGPRYLAAQKYLPAVSKGDKRIFLVDGDIVGYVNRIPKKGEFLANIHQGARCEKTEVSDRENLILEKIRPFIIENGLFLLGVDFIDGFVTEINLTSPSAVRQINQHMGAKIQKKIVDSMLSKMSPSCCCRGTKAA